MNILEEICIKKKESVSKSKKIISESSLLEEIKKKDPVKGFKKSLSISVENGFPGIIAEIKKGSPSKGIIKEDFNPARIAQEYSKGGASCISVLTDTPYFYGKNQDAIDVIKAVEIPVIRKDFMISEYQILETRALGCDCVLLILSILDDYQLKTLYDLSISLKMDVLIEAHSELEIERVQPYRNALIGINNRNLKNFSTDINNTIRLASKLPADTEIICESGISSLKDINYIASKGVNRFLIGEYLMKQKNIEKELSAITSIKIG